MCGIFGYIGKKAPVDICLQGLKLLEYRGYDSAGLAGINKNNAIYTIKELGNVAKLEKKISLQELDLSTVIAHTRWATHGEPSERNAHPHIDAENSLAIIHNGIIENHTELREELKKNGIKCVSDTDTEVLAQLIALNYKKNILTAVSDVLKKIKGSFAIALIHKDYPNQIIAAARDNPLAVGYEENEIFLSSDPNAFLGHNLNLFYLKNDEIALMNRSGISLYDTNEKPISREAKFFEGKNTLPSKEGYEHFMLKEIFEQPKTIQKALLSHHLENFGLQNLVSSLPSITNILIAACGSSWHAGSFAASLLEEMVHIPSRAEIASELRYKHPPLSEKTLFIAISQSGETADTLSAVKAAKAKGAKILAICNVPNSTLTREADCSLFLHAGPECSVCSTKAFTSQVTVLYLLTLYLAKIFKTIEKEKEQNLLDDLHKIPNLIESVLAKKEDLKHLANLYHTYDHFFFLGRHHMLVTSQEAALKLKEVSYVNANSYPAGELKHGPIALLSSSFPVVAFVANSETYEKTLSNLMEVKARKAPLIAIGFEGMEELKKIADHTFLLPKTSDSLAIFPAIIAGQLFAYYVALNRKTEIDQPRNLAKSVTVE